jgi:hypothetical protein
VTMKSGLTVAGSAMGSEIDTIIIDIVYFNSPQNMSYRN